VTAAVAAVASVAAAAVAAVAAQAAQAAQAEDCIDATEQPAAPAHLPEACEEQGPNALSGAAAAAEEAEAQERLLRPHAGTPERRPSFGSRLRRAFAALVVLPDPQEEEEEAHGPELQLTRTHSGAECAICLATLGSCVETPCGSTARLWALRPSPSLINAVWPSRCLDLSPSRTPSPPSFPPLPSPAAAATPSMPPASSTTLQPRASPDNGLAARTVAPRCTRPCRSRRAPSPACRWSLSLRHAAAAGATLTGTTASSTSATLGGRGCCLLSSNEDRKTASSAVMWVVEARDAAEGMRPRCGWDAAEGCGRDVAEFA